MPPEDTLAEPVSTAHFTGQQGPLLSLLPLPQQCQVLGGILMLSPDWGCGSRWCHRDGSPCPEGHL